jgi:CubicO group peptidase (beta-lactamase class C family)
LGEPHDDNAAYLMGAAGHAGLFSTARDLLKIVASLSGASLGRHPSVDQGLMGEFMEPRKAADGSLRPLGFDMLPLRKGRLLGHLGYTGATLWWSPALGRVMVLLTNRVHPSARDLRIRDLRAALVDLIFPELL